MNDQARSGSRYLDSRLHGVFVEDRATLSTGRLQYWLLYRENGQFGDEINTLGLRFSNDSLSWQPQVQAAYQFGDFGGLSHSAWMMRAGVRRDFMQGSLGFAYAYGSGDANPDDREHQTLDNLYPLNHPYYGYMDLFCLQNLHNIEARYRRRLRRNAQINVSWNVFALAEEDTDAWYNAGLAPVLLASDNVDALVGHELDITLEAQFAASRLSLLVGASAFSTGSYLDDFGLERDARFYYLGATYRIQ